MFAPTVSLWGLETPPVVLDRPGWLAALAGAANSLHIHGRCVGTLRRDDGWSCDDRAVDGHWLLIALDGRSRGDAEGVDVSVEPGALFYIPPGVRHRMQWSQRMRFAEVYFSVRSGRTQVGWSDRAVRVEGAGDLKRAVDRIADEVQTRAAYSESRLCAMLASLVIDLWRLEERGSHRAEGLSPAQQQRVLRYTRERGAAGLIPQDLADELGLSAGYFSRLFRESFGASPRVWLNRRRIEDAATLLERTGDPVYRIADQLGYAGVAQFSRQFKHVMGVPPRAYRQRGAGRPAAPGERER